MRITYRQLKQLIKEQVQTMLEIDEPSGAPTAPTALDVPTGSGVQSRGPQSRDARTPRGAHSPLPVQISDWANLILGSTPSARSTLNLCTRVARLLQRGQEAEAAQAYTWLVGNVSRANARVRNLIAGVNAMRSSPAPEGMQTAEWNQFVRSVNSWASSARPVIASLAPALPASLPAAGSPERAQLITALNQAATSLRASNSQWEGIVRQSAAFN